MLLVVFCLVNSTISHESAPASFIFKVQCPIGNLDLQFYNFHYFTILYIYDIII